MVVQIADLTFVVFVNKALGMVDRGSVFAFADIFRAVTISSIVIDIV